MMKKRILTACALVLLLLLCTAAALGGSAKICSVCGKEYNNVYEYDESISGSGGHHIHCSECNTVLSDDSCTYQSNSCTQDKKCQYCQHVLENSAGHDWDTVTYDWADDYSACTASRVCKRDSTHTETLQATVSSTTTATCTAAGVTTYTAVFGETWAATQTASVNTDGPVHAYVETARTDATCTVDGSVTYTCSKCTKSYTDTIEAPGHDFRYTKYGYYTSYHDITCAKCDYQKYFVSCSGGTKTCSQRPICDYCKAAYGPEVSHQMGEATDLTYEWREYWDGWQCAAYRKCTAAGCDYAIHVYATITSRVVSKQTCETDGVTVYTARFQSYSTGSWFEKVQTQTKTVTKEKLGHKYNSKTFIYPSDDRTTCNVVETCARNSSHKRTTTVDTKVFDSQAATCTEDGWTRVVATVSGPAFVSDKYIDPKLGHDWNNVTYEWADDYSTCTAKRVCKRDATHVETSQATITGVNTATCTATGIITYTAVFPDTWASTATKTVKSQPLQHDWDEPTIAWSADNSTCTVQRVCKRDAAHVQTAVSTVACASKPADCTDAVDTYTVTYDFGGGSNSESKTVVRENTGAGHWYGEWQPSGNGHSTDCLRSGCTEHAWALCENRHYQMGDGFTVCPICGKISTGDGLALVGDAAAVAVTNHLPGGELIVRTGKTAEDAKLISVCFGYGGKLLQAFGQVKITLPAEIVNGGTLKLLAQDGTETDLAYTIDGDGASFTVDLSDEPAALIRIVPAAEPTAQN